MQYWVEGIRDLMVEKSGHLEGIYKKDDKYDIIMIIILDKQTRIC